MKKLTVVLLLAFLYAGAAQGQLIKKLKEKAEKAIESTTGSGSAQKKTETESEPEQERKLSKKEPDTIPSYCTVVFKLESGETFMHDETSIAARNNAVNYQFVVSNRSYEYFLIDNGKRTGPFKQAPMASAKGGDDDGDNGSSNSDDDNMSMGGDHKDPVSLQYSKTIGGKLYLVFNGKNYGPYDYVNKMLVSPDKKQFFAIVVNGGLNSMMSSMGMGQHYIVNEKGVKQKVGDENGIAFKFYTNNSFTHVLAILMSKGGQAVEIATSAGKQLDATMADVNNSKKNIMVSDKGDIISIPAQSPTQILVNGNEAARFSVPITNIDRLFLMPDISKSVYYANGKIYKADGSVIPTKGILYPRVLNIDNQMVLHYFKVYQSPNGDKNVYLCKKVI